MKRTGVMRSILALGIITILTSTAMAVTISNPVANTARDLVKLTKGNKWVYAITETSNDNDSHKSVTTNYELTDVIINAVRNKSATYRTTSSLAGTHTIETTNYFDNKGNLLADNPALKIKGALKYPAQVVVGASWGASKIVSTNDTYTGPAGTFYNLVRIDLSDISRTDILGTVVTIKRTGYTLVSPALGNIVYETRTQTTSVNSFATTETTTAVLQPGYIVN